MVGGSRHVPVSIWLMSPGASAEDRCRHDCLRDVRSVTGAYAAWRHLRHVLTISVQDVKEACFCYFKKNQRDAFLAPVDMTNGEKGDANKEDVTISETNRGGL